MTDPKQTVEYMLGEMNAKLDDLTRNFTTVTTNHAPRIAHLERWRARVTAYSAGAIGVITTVAGIIKFLHG
jgi:phage shock protein A